MLHIFSLEPLPYKPSMSFQVLGLWLHLQKFFLGLGLTVTEINIKLQVTESWAGPGNKAIKKVQKQEDESEINIQSLIPAFFTLQLHSSVKETQGWSFIHLPLHPHLVFLYYVFILS